MNGSLESGLKYKKVAHGGDAIMGYVDAKYVEHVDTMKSLFRYAFTLFGATICWKGNLQPMVALSTIESRVYCYCKMSMVKRDDW